LVGEEGRECKSCLLLREWLDIEREKRDYYERLLLIRSGILAVDQQSAVDDENYLPLRRITTMSSLRREAASIASKKSKDPELTEAERKFEESLNARKQ